MVGRLSPPLRLVIHLVWIGLIATEALPASQPPPWNVHMQFVEQATGKSLFFRSDGTVSLTLPPDNQLLRGSYVVSPDGSSVTINFPELHTGPEQLVLKGDNLVDARQRIWVQQAELGRIMPTAALRPSPSPPPLGWGPLQFTEPSISAPNRDLTLAVSTLNYRFKHHSPLKLVLRRYAGRTAFRMDIGGCTIAGDPHDPTSVQEIREMLDRAQDWSAKAHSNNITNLKKTLFSFTKTRFTDDYNDRNPFLALPAEFVVEPENGKITVTVYFQLTKLDESDLPAFKYAVDHVQDLLTAYEEHAIPIERDELAKKKKIDELFKP